MRKKLAFLLSLFIFISSVSVYADNSDDEMVTTVKIKNESDYPIAISQLDELGDFSLYGWTFWTEENRLVTKLVQWLQAYYANEVTFLPIGEEVELPLVDGKVLAFYRQDILETGKNLLGISKWVFSTYALAGLNLSFAASMYWLCQGASNKECLINNPGKRLSLEEMDALNDGDLLRVFSSEKGLEIGDQ